MLLSWNTPVEQVKSTRAAAVFVSNEFPARPIQEIKRELAALSFLPDLLKKRPPKKPARSR